MLYANSAEEQKYLSHIRRERESFERLIKERSSMAIPLQAERRPDEDRADDYLRTVSTRIAGGGRHARADPPQVSALAMMKSTNTVLKVVDRFAQGHRRYSRVPIFSTFITARSRVHRRSRYSDYWRLRPLARSGSRKEKLAGSYTEFQLW